MTKNKRNNKNFISVIIPSYKQEKTIEQDLRRIKSVLDQLRYDYEMIVVVDGNVDNTYKNARKVKYSRVKVLGYKKNHGKGYAIRYGMKKAKGKMVAFIDAGMDLNPNGLSMLLEHFEWYKADIIVGSKWHPVSKVTYPFLRTIISRGYSLLVRLLFRLGISDTQLGMKIYRRKVLRKVLAKLLVKKYAFDIELLAVADRLGFSRIYEAPVELNWEKINSNVSSNLPKTILDMLWDTLAVFYRLKILRYYDNLEYKQKKSIKSRYKYKRSSYLSKAKLLTVGNR